jgi:putative nucleotidyltransferase with HDIG domain
MSHFRRGLLYFSSDKPINKGVKVSEFIPIELELLRIDTILGVDLYLKTPHGFILYRSHRVPFNDKVRRNLMAHGVNELYIATADTAKFDQYLENNLTGILDDPEIKAEVKSRLVYESSLNIARDLLLKPNSISTIKRSTKIVQSMVDLHLKDDGGFKKLVELMPTDYNIFSHCANVSTYSIALGKSLGVFNKNELYELGLGAFLHDIGKSKIPKEILNKPARLTTEEFEIVKEHVQIGYSIAEKIPIVPRHSMVPILLHHERLSGNGYPHGKYKEEIPVTGLITAVADAFDAMTTRRVYQKAMKTFSALQILLSDDENFDRRVVLEMIKLMSPEKDKAEVPIQKKIITT